MGSAIENQRLTASLRRSCCSRGVPMIYGIDYNAVDIGAMALVLLEVIMGLRRGLAGSLFRLMCTLLVLLAGLRLHQPFGDLLARHTTWLDGNPEMAGALAFLLIAVVLSLVFLLAQVLLRVLMTVTFNEKINRKGGGIVGFFQGLALVFLLVYAIGLWPTPSVRRLFVENSIAGRTVFRLCPRVISAIDDLEIRVAPAVRSLEQRE